MKQNPTQNTETPIAPSKQTMHKLFSRLTCVIKQCYNHKKLFHVTAQIVLSLLLVLIFISCEKELRLDIPHFEQQVVVEGSIEQGNKARILLSLTAPFFNSFDSLTMLDYKLTTATVVIHSGNQYEWLKLRRNENYFPPLIYESKIKGKVNTLYTIDIINRGDTTRGSAFIPKPPVIDSVWHVLKQGSDSSYLINIQFSDDASTKDYYLIYTKIKDEENNFYPARNMVYDDAFFNGKQITFSIQRGLTSILDVADKKNFRTGTTVYVKLCTVSKDVFEFWNSYQNLLISSANPFASPNSTLQSNVHNGIGVFGGYGVDIDTISITDSTK